MLRSLLLLLIGRVMWPIWLRGRLSRPMLEKLWQRLMQSVSGRPLASWYSALRQRLG